MPPHRKERGRPFFESLSVNQGEETAAPYSIKYNSFV